MSAQVQHFSQLGNSSNWDANKALDFLPCDRCSWCTSDYSRLLPPHASEYNFDVSFIVKQVVHQLERG